MLLAVVGTLTAQAEPLKYALGLFESGATSYSHSPSDRMRGGSGEVSRFQIMPDVWKRYSASKAYQNPDVAWTVTKKILNDRIQDFQRRSGRAPNAIEIYLLWNKPGHFSAMKFSLERVHPRYLDRAQRFANLYYSVEESYRNLYNAQLQQVAWNVSENPPQS